MRILFATAPALGHLFPAVPLAWALRAAGHEVLVAASAGAADAAVRAGLAAVDVSPDADFGAVFGVGQGSERERAAALRERGRAVAGAAGTPEFILQRFARVSDLMADGTLRAARHWRPDLVVYSRLQGAGLLAARALGVPAVEHGFNLQREGLLPQRYLPHLADSFRRAGVPCALPALVAVHVGPPSMMVGEGAGWAMRYVPYNAGGLLPEWLTAPRARPRVAVTLGTVVPRMAGVGGLSRLLSAASQVDAEFVLALGGADTTALGPLPGNVRPVGWVPLHALLAGCDALVHHGGAGSTLTALAAGVPQLVLPHGADQFVHARAVVRRGAGLAREPEEVDRGAVEALLDGDALRSAAAQVAAEMAAQPAPADLVAGLERLAATP